MSEARVYNAPAGLDVMLATDTEHADLYDSWFDLPVARHAFSTERKVVERGQGGLLKRFLESPVHTGRDRAAVPTHRLPNWVEPAIEAVVVGAQRQNAGYTVELVGSGHPSVGWVLQRLRGRRAMRYHAPGPLGDLGPQALRELADEFQLAHWRHGIHYVLRLTAFDSEAALRAWVAGHPPGSTPIPRALPPVQCLPSGVDGERGQPWFEAWGAYAAPHALPLEPAAEAFAFRKLSNGQMIKAYWSRGPDNAIVNFFNWPIEAFRLTWDPCPPGTVLTRFACDLRLEVYVQ